MKDVNNRMQRMELMEKFLNAQTTVEEERLLQQFYQNCNSPLTPDEEDIKLIVLSTIGNGLTTDGGNMPDMDALEHGAEEFDRLMQEAEQSKLTNASNETDNLYKVGNIKLHDNCQIAQKVVWTLILAAAAVAGFVFLSPKVPTFYNQQIAMVSGDTMKAWKAVAESGQERRHDNSVQKLIDNEQSRDEQMEDEQYPTNHIRPATERHNTAGQNNKVKKHDTTKQYNNTAGQAHTTVLPHTTKANASEAERTTMKTAEESSRTMNVAEIYDVATTAFAGSEDVTAENRNGRMCITVTAKDGTKTRYAVISTDSETYTLVALD